MLLDYCTTIADEYVIKVGDVMKLIPNLGHKTNYVIHYRNLQLYLPLGMKLTKIQNLRSLTGWKNILILTLKKNATNSFEKNFFKLMINSVFGETMENLLKRISKCQTSK